MTTPQSVTIKKAKRSTFIQNKRHLTTHRIGDINVVDWRWCLPSDVFRYKVSHSIKADALLAPAFARMKVYTDLFYVSLKSIMPDIYEKIPNFDQQTKTSMKNGRNITSTPYYFPSEDLGLIQRALLSGNRTPSGSSETYPLTDWTGYTILTGGQYVGLSDWYSGDGEFPYTDYPDNNYEMLHWDITRKYDVAQLCSQMGFPPVVTRIATDKDVLFTPSTISKQETFYSDIDNYTNGTLLSYLANSFGVELSSSNFDDYYYKGTAKIQGVNFSTLPFKAYQKVYNEWFINAQLTKPVDLFPDVVTWLSDDDFKQPHSTYNNTYAYIGPITMTNRALLYLNSLFRIRKCWYAKDYFNTASNDNHLVTGQNIGSTVLDLRKANAIQRLLEKRALVGGNRFFDFVAQHWNFFPDNLELDRPLHLGSDVDFINIGEILQTSESTSSSAQGERAGTANAFSRGKGVLFNSPDYGILLCLSRIVPEIDYLSQFG